MKRRLYWCAWGTAVILHLLININSRLLPEIMVTTPLFNSLSHAAGGMISGWGYFLTYQSAYDGNWWSDRVVKLALLFGGVIALGICFELFQFHVYQIGKAHSHAVLYKALTDNLHLYVVLGILFAAGLTSMGFFRDFHITDRGFLSAYLISGVAITATVWELYEYWFLYHKLGQWTALSIYEDTTKDLLMDMIGGVFFLWLVRWRNPHLFVTARNLPDEKSSGKFLISAQNFKSADVEILASRY